MFRSISPRLGALLVLSVQLALGWFFSVIQPLGRAPDETAHVQYVAFLAQKAQLPIFQAQGGGVAGYEAQHPPLYYALGAVVYRLSSGQDEALRWHLLRWATLLCVGGALFFASLRFFQTLWPLRPRLALAATASVVWMPLSLLYCGYINPDGLVAVWCAFTLWFCARAFRGEVSRRDAVLLGAWCGLALLTKLSGFPCLLIALWALWKSQHIEKKLKLALCLGTTTLLALPWYARSAWLYGSPFIHTQGKLGTGFENAARGGFEFFAWLTWRETFLSTWAQRGWFPDGPWTFALYGAVVASILGSAFWWLKGRRQNDVSPSQNATFKLCGALVLLVFLGQQWAFWTVDVEFNAGGRYLLSAMPAIIALLFGGWLHRAKIGRIWGAIWLAVLLVMNLVSIQNIVDVLNPRYAPGWKMFHFAPGEEKRFRF